MAEVAEVVRDKRDIYDLRVTCRSRAEVDVSFWHVTSRHDHPSDPLGKRIGLAHFHTMEP